MSVTPEINIVIVSFNVKEYLCKCIDSLLNQKDILAEIIVVDNNSTDGTRELIKSKYPSVRLIFNSDNSGFSAANNQGIRESLGEKILLLNPDTELTEADTLGKMRDYLDSGSDIAVMAPCLLNSDGTVQTSFWKYPGVKELLLELFYLHRMKKTKQTSRPIEVEAASGAALFFRKSLFDEIGGLDETMFWMEDTDFCYRAIETGKKIMFNPGIKIIHHGGKSSVENYSITIPNQVMSRIKFSKKHNSMPVFFLVNGISLIFISSRIFMFTFLSFINATFKSKRKAYQVALKSYFRFNFNGDSSIIK